ncbi:MAG: DUF1697 domain-containing protein [Gemmatimonadaceae bacterium]|nr:DUF1697 domain-containing protein [Gemmatimonadaceae bacterium]
MATPSMVKATRSDADVPMQRYVGLLRGMNVGGHRVSMETLRAHVTAFGMRNVATYIASGNLIFDAPASSSAPLIESALAAHLQQAVGFPMPLFLRTPSELAQIVASVPFADIAGVPTTTHVGFFREAPHAQTVVALESAGTDVDDLAVIGRELYWRCRGKTTDSKIVWRPIERAHALEVTMRNVKTVVTLAEKYASPL